MNALQFYYVNTVLGASSVIQPQKIRSAYCLHRSSEKQTNFLFFCNHLNTKEEKELIQKIATAIDHSESMIVEILDMKNTHIPLLLNNFLTRFLPKGFVIFGHDLAFRLARFSSNKTKDKKINWKGVINKNQQHFVPGCVLNTMSDFTGPASLEVRERKKQAWNTLRQTFSS